MTPLPNADIDAAIALSKGYVYEDVLTGDFPLRRWIAPNGDWSYDPPNFTGDWEHAGPLFEELVYECNSSLEFLDALKSIWVYLIAANTVPEAIARAYHAAMLEAGEEIK